MHSVLLIEDDSDIRMLAELSLIQDGLTVVSRGDGASALAQIAAHDFALVILDVMMPDMTGFEVINQMRDLRATDLPPVALFSAHPLSARDVQPHMPPVVGVLPKPFVPAELAKAVRKLIELRPGK